MGFPGTSERKSFNEGVKRGGFGERPSRGGFGDRGGRGGRGGFGDRGGRGGRGGFGDRGGRGGRGGFSDRGGRGGRGGARGGSSKPKVAPFKEMSGIYTLKDSILTKNFAPGETVYGEKKVIETSDLETGKKIEYRIWNPFRSKIGAALHQNIEEIHIGEGDRVLYLGAANGTTVSHVSDIVGEKGIVYAVEFSKRSGRDLEHMSTNRPNIIPIIDDARHPANYRLIVGTVDTIFADVAQPDQSRIVAMNAEWFLKKGGHVLISVKASCIDSTATPEAVYSKEVEFLRKSNIKPLCQTDLGDFQRGHAMISGQYLPN